MPARKIHVGADGKVADAGDSKVPGPPIGGEDGLADKETAPRRDEARDWEARRLGNSFAVELPPTGEFDVSNLPAESLTVGGSVPGYRFSGQT